MPKTVLVVEDNELNTKLFNDLLQAHDYNTILLDHGAKAIETIRKRKPDLIIMDIQLPDISGVELITTLKADPALKHLPIIAVTAFAMKGDEEKIQESGADDYVSKPISVPLFLEKVKAFLG